MAICMALFASGSMAYAQVISSPDGNLKVHLSMGEGGRPQYAVTYGDDTIIEQSHLGLNTSIADFTKDLTLSKEGAVQQVSDTYDIVTLKKRNITYTANEQTFTYSQNGKPALDITFHVDNQNVAFRYMIYRQKKERQDERVACLVTEEMTDYTLPVGTTTFICPQMTPQTGFARTAPSYETYYEYDGEMGKNGHGRGYTFPALFKVPAVQESLNGLKSSKGSISNHTNSSNSIWVMLCETDVAGNYCGSRLECKDNSYNSYNHNGKSCKKHCHLLAHLNVKEISEEVL